MAAELAELCRIAALWWILRQILDFVSACLIGSDRREGILESPRSSGIWTIRRRILVNASLSLVVCTWLVGAFPEGRALRPHEVLAACLIFLFLETGIQLQEIENLFQLTHLAAWYEYVLSLKITFSIAALGFVLGSLKVISKYEMRYFNAPEWLSHGLLGVSLVGFGALVLIVCVVFLPKNVVALIEHNEDPRFLQ